MRIIFIMGVPGAGKSTYAKKNFPDFTFIDLKDFQKKYASSSIETIAKTYDECRDALIEAIKRNEDVIMEHTLLKAVRREVYIKAVKEVTDTPIEIIVMNPPKEIIKENLYKRDNITGDWLLNTNLDILEIPTIDEGFDSVTVVYKQED